MEWMDGTMDGGIGRGTHVARVWLSDSWMLDTEGCNLGPITLMNSRVVSTSAAWTPSHPLQKLQWLHAQANHTQQATGSFSRQPAGGQGQMHVDACARIDNPWIAVLGDSSLRFK